MDSPTSTQQADVRDSCLWLLIRTLLYNSILSQDVCLLLVSLFVCFVYSISIFSEHCVLAVVSDFCF